jgi:carbonic anhydrase
MPTPAHVLARLIEGNKRFVANVRGIEATVSNLRRAELALSQKPHTVILGCSDSRVPSEIVFDQGLGDLFVIRVAGNIVAPSQLASVEYAAQRFGTSLVIVLGHTGCGAVDAALDDVLPHAAASPPSLSSIVSRIRPLIAPLVELDPDAPREALMRAGVRANIRASVEHIRRGTALIESMVNGGEMLVVGAEYDLVSGRVEVLDAPPLPAA